MDPHAPRFTAHQQRVIADGRKALLARWRDPASAYRRGVPESFGVDWAGPAYIDGDLYDIYATRNAGAALPECWHRDAAQVFRHRIEFMTTGVFHILVPTRYYLNAQWLPFGVDGAFVRAVGAPVALATLALLGAVALNGAQ